MFEYAKPEQKHDLKKTVQKKETKPNLTGIPDTMKTQFETKSGLSFDDVRVHYNSDKPAQLQALAYTQGNQVYVAPGQERHLGHELGHVVQQKQGKVKPTTKINGININDENSLEIEADEFRYKKNPMINTQNNKKTFQLPTAQCLQEFSDTKRLDFQKYVRSRTVLIAELEGNPVGERGGWFESTSGKHAEENLIDALKGLRPGHLKIWINASPCSSTYETRVDGKMGCQERLEELQNRLKFTIEVYADHPYQPKGVEHAKLISAFAAGASDIPIDFDPAVAQLKKF